MGRFPQVAVVLQGRVVMRRQLRRQLGVQGRAFLGGAARNGFDGQGAGLTTLPEIPLDGGQRDLEQCHNLGAWGAVIDRMQDALSEVG